MRYLIAVKKNTFLITNSRIGKHQLNQTLNSDYDKHEFDITLNSKNHIRSIIVYSKEYKTKEGFSVGVNLESIERLSNSKRKELKILKGSISIGSIGKVVVYNDILFVDENNDGIVDFVWVQRS